jgi:hypothetical protein
MSTPVSKSDFINNELLLNKFPLIPNQHYASDHIPIGAIIDFMKTAQTA